MPGVLQHVSVLALGFFALFAALVYWTALLPLKWQIVPVRPMNRFARCRAPASC